MTYNDPHAGLTPQMLTQMHKQVPTKSGIHVLAPGVLYSTESDTLYLTDLNTERGQWVSCSGKAPAGVLLEKLLETQRELRETRHAMFSFKYREAWKKHLEEYRASTNV